MNLRDGTRSGSDRVIRLVERNTHVVKFKPLVMPPLAEIVRDRFFTITDDSILRPFHSQIEGTLDKMGNQPSEYVNIALIDAVVLFRLGRLHEVEKRLNEVIQLSENLEMPILKAVAELNYTNLQWEMDSKSKTLNFKKYAIRYRDIVKILPTPEVSLNALKASFQAFQANESSDYTKDFDTLCSLLPIKQDPQVFHHIVAYDEDLGEKFINSEVFKSWWANVPKGESDETSN